ncbi:hypothetical protein SUDANB146_06397 [Streptomyces sp. enrichment culture]
MLADLVDADGVLPDMVPGVLMDGDDIGRWLKRQKQPGAWKELSAEQQERLTVLGVQPLEGRSSFPAGAARAGAGGTAAKGTGKAQQALQRGLAALAQWVEREGAHRPVPRGHAEEILVGGEAEPVTVKWGGVGPQHQDPAGQAHRGAAGRASGAGRPVGVTLA